MARLNPLDEQLRALVQWRNQRLDELVQALIDVDAAQQRIDVLLDRKNTTLAPSGR